MKLEIEERGNIHLDMIWYEIVDSELLACDESNTIAIIDGKTDNHYKLGCLFVAAPDLFTACQKLLTATNRLLEICISNKENTNITYMMANDAITCAKKAISKANYK
jgi:hypothetical protein